MDIHWLLLYGSPFFGQQWIYLAGGGWWWKYFGWWWMVMGGGIVQSNPSSYNQSEWLEEYKNSGLYYSRAFDETSVNGFTPNNVNDTFDEEELRSSDKDYKGGQAQGKKDDETTESNENFDCYTIQNSNTATQILKQLTLFFLLFFQMSFRVVL